MIVIFAEKVDMGSKIAAALDCIRFPDGKTVGFQDLSKHEKAVKALQARQGYLDITFRQKPVKVTWGYGHLCGLKHATDYNPDYKLWSKLPVPFIPEDFQLKLNPGVEQHFEVVKKLFNSAEHIINAGDPDREGEVIFAYIYEMCGCKTPYSRAWFTEVTQAGIQGNFSKLKKASEMKPLEQAGRARAIADWVVGINLTAQMTLKYRGSGTLSIGRVQTPVLHMLVTRELAIRNFKPEDFWRVQARFTVPAGDYTGHHKTERFATVEEAQKVLEEVAGRPGRVTSVRTEKYSKDPPMLYSLTTLQMDADEIHGLSLEETLKCAQSLYEGGYTTYPRTDSQYLNDDMEPVVREVLGQLERKPEYEKYLAGRPRVYKKARYFNSSMVSSHHAIIPTNKPPVTLKGNSALVYDLIAKSLIRIIYPAAEANRTRVVTTVGPHDFISNGSVITSMGWLQVDGKSNERFLPPVSEGDEAEGQYEVKKGKTKPPAPYTAKGIVAAMETAGKDLPDAELRKILAGKNVGGIGRPATRAGLIETLIKRGYVARKGRQLRATELGIGVIEKLPCGEVKSAEMTAQWEKRLNLIAEKKERYDAFIADINAQTGKWANEIRAITDAAPLAGPQADGKETLKCPCCGSGVRKYDWGWGCTGYQGGCKFGVRKAIAGKKLTDKQAETLITKGKTGEIKGFVSKAGTKFSARLVIEGAGVKFQFPPKAEEGLS